MDTMVWSIGRRWPTENEGEGAALDTIQDENRLFFFPIHIIDPPLNMKDGWGSSSSSVAGFIHWFEGGKGGSVLYTYFEYKRPTPRRATGRIGSQHTI
jgi:hypothetical protein